MRGASEVVHATAVAVGGRAALIRGAPGAGKSDLALRCLAMAPSALISAPALLVSDDQVRVQRNGDGVIATAPDSIRGKLEVRGIGIMSAPAAPEAQVVLIVDLVSSEDIERFPATTHVASILGIELPVLKLAPFEASAAAKLLLALAQASGHALPP